MHENVTTIQASPNMANRMPTDMSYDMASASIDYSTLTLHSNCAIVSSSSTPVYAAMTVPVRPGSHM